MLQASPDFKGIKTQIERTGRRTIRLQASPDFKGIKTWRPWRACWQRCFKPALISKGLRPAGKLIVDAISLQASPDFKGIKTCSHNSILNSLCFKPALISKGLRLSIGEKCDDLDRFKPALISKGLRPDQFCTTPFQCFKPALISKGLRRTLCKNQSM